MSLTRRFAAATATLALGFAGACGSDSGPTAPTAMPVIGVSATTGTTASTVTIGFMSRAGDNSYNIERAEGASGTFSQVGTVGRIYFQPDGTMVVAGMSGGRMRLYHLSADREVLAQVEVPASLRELTLLVHTRS